MKEVETRGKRRVENQQENEKKKRRRRKGWKNGENRKKLGQGKGNRVKVEKGGDRRVWRSPCAPHPGYFMDHAVQLQDLPVRYRGPCLPRDPLPFRGSQPGFLGVPWGLWGVLGPP